MSLIGSLSLALLAVGLLVATAQLPRLWRDTGPVATPQPWWPYGQRHWLRFVRAMPIALLMGWLMVLSAGVSIAFGNELSTDVARLILLVFAAAIALFLTAYFFAWPAFVVPPSLRRRNLS